MSRGMVRAKEPQPKTASRQSHLALGAANFFLADMTAVVVPFLGTFLRARGYGYDAIGVAIAAQGLGTLLFQTPAGVATDLVPFRRFLLAFASLIVALSYALIPFVPARDAKVVDALLFTAGAASAFFGPLLAALALGLSGHDRLDRTVASNQSLNHLGNIAAALVALFLVALDARWVFYSIVAASICAVVSTGLIRRPEIDRYGQAPLARERRLETSGIRRLLRDRRVAALFTATSLFHLANAPVMPLVALAVKHSGGSERQAVSVVLVAQAVMVPVAWLAGRSCERFGRKWTLAVGFFVLPVRIASYAFARGPAAYLFLQVLDGVGAGIYGVTVISMCADLTRGTGSFNTLTGVIATAAAAGGVIGPIGAGWLVERTGFEAAFLVFAAIAFLAAAVLQAGLPETKRGLPGRTPARASAGASN